MKIWPTAPPRDAHLAQPTGLALDSEAGVLYFVDSETSSVRAVDVGDGVVETLVGVGLFEFGRRNGDFAQARLQHCRGICLARRQPRCRRHLQQHPSGSRPRSRRVSELGGDDCQWGNGLRLAGGEPAGVDDGRSPAAIAVRHQPSSHHRAHLRRTCSSARLGGVAGVPPDQPFRSSSFAARTTPAR